MISAAPFQEGFYSVIAELVRQFGGVPASFPGGEQALEAIFGIPRAYASDAERCLRCTDEIVSLLQRQRPESTSVLLMRQGIWSGEHMAVKHPVIPDPGFAPVANGSAILVESDLVRLLMDHFAFSPPVAGYARSGDNPSGNPFRLLQALFMQSGVIGPVSSEQDWAGGRAADRNSRRHLQVERRHETLGTHARGIQNVMLEEGPRFAMVRLRDVPH